MWQDAITAAHGTHGYPLFEELAAKMRDALDEPGAPTPREDASVR
jgi:hypothetical protein